MVEQRRQGDFRGGPIGSGGEGRAVGVLFAGVLCSTWGGTGEKRLIGSVERNLLRKVTPREKRRPGEKRIIKRGFEELFNIKLVRDFENNCGSCLSCFNKLSSN